MVRVTLAFVMVLAVSMAAFKRGSVEKIVGCCSCSAVTDTRCERVESACSAMSTTACTSRAVPTDSGMMSNCRVVAL